MLKKILPFVTICFFFFQASAQGELGLQLIPGLLQNAKTNPALVPDEKLIIGLPGFYGGYFHTAGSVSDLLTITSDTSGQLNVPFLLDNMKAENTLRVNQEIETIYAFYRVSDKVALSLSHSAKSSNYLLYPETLPKLFWQGNSQYIGEETAFGPDQHTFAYNEIALGTAVTFGKLTIGGKAKLLLGVGDISTERTKASLYTDPDIYQLTLNTDYLINTSTFSEVLLFDTLSGYKVEYGWKELLSFENFQTKNKGYAFDFGLNYKVTDKLSVAASVIDLGKINWRKSKVNYISNGSYTLEGLDFKTALSGDSLSLSSAVDSVKVIFDFETTIEDYSTKLPTKIYINANYKVNDKWSVAASFQTESYRDRNFLAFGIGGHYIVSENFSFGLSYGVRNETYDNIGLNIIARKGPVQFFLTTDNIIAAVQPYNSDNVNFRAGFNLIFDKKETTVEIRD